MSPFRRPVRRSTAGGGSAVRPTGGGGGEHDAIGHHRRHCQAGLESGDSGLPVAERGQEHRLLPGRDRLDGIQQVEQLFAAAIGSPRQDLQDLGEGQVLDHVEGGCGLRGSTPGFGELPLLPVLRHQRGRLEDLHQGLFEASDRDAQGARRERERQGHRHAGGDVQRADGEGHQGQAELAEAGRRRGGRHLDHPRGRRAAAGDLTRSRRRQERLRRRGRRRMSPRRCGHVVSTDCRPCRPEVRRRARSRPCAGPRCR